ncbi:MAG: bifunctional glutamate N-acetyltransferase/amino-acid acetyltransferase ArgJ [Actinobacteria bacterium]|nr:bifunctional glutamate N-acetyltransferase/amino-acid acetyltransferase ArgJ [Actinomycetota bacterium]
MPSKRTNNTITGPLGFHAGAVSCGLKAGNTPDLAVLVCEHPAEAAGVFTTNKVFAAPVAVCREHIANGKSQAVIVNAGNANACTGAAGMKNAKEMAARTGKRLGISSENVLVASTGIIGQRLPMDKVRSGIDAAVEKLNNSAKAGREFSRAIMTTDRYAKTSTQEIRIDGCKVRIAGTAKGAGMIAPNMATMLCFITSDVAISNKLLGRLLKRSVTTSFNAITVDNHMSTNDTAIIMASGLAGNGVLKNMSAAAKFAGALDDVCLELALQMVSDGEGATKGLEVVVRGARSISDARKAGLAVANSPLVKCALFGGDPNWGRIVSAVGACDIACKQERIDCKIGTQYVLRKGSPVTVNKRPLDKTMAEKVVTIKVDLHMGKADFRCYGCDLTPEYVRINADYHT